MLQTFKIQRYNIPLNIVENYDLKQDSITFTSGTFLLEPTILDDSKIAFITNKGLIYVFDINTIANYIYLTSFRGKFNFLYSTSFGSYVTLSFSPNNFYVKYVNYLCLFSKTNTSINTCKLYVDTKNKEGAEQVNPLNINENTFAVINKNFTGIKEFYLAKYSDNLSREWEQSLSGNIANGGITKDSKNNIISSSNVITKVNSENGEVLGTYSTNIPNGYYFYRSSIASITANGNYYVFVQNKKANKNVYENTIYKFKGEKEGVINPCPLGIYCNSTPKHNPVIIIHGLGEHYTNFLNEKTGILRTNISNAPLSEDFLKTANLGLYLGYTKGVLDVSHDSFLDSITTLNHLYIPENDEIINSVIYQLKE